LPPVTSSNNQERSSSGAPISSNQVIWSGPDIECIDLCKGDTISDVQYKVASKLCDLLESLNFSDVDLKCLNEEGLCDIADKSIRNVVIILIKAFCKLKDDLGGGQSVEDESKLEVNLRCLAITDQAGNILNDDSNNEIVQTIIDSVCANTFDIELLKSKLDSLTEVVNSIPQQVPYQLPSITSCLYTGAKKLDVAVGVLSADYCSLKAATGGPSDISAGMVQQSPALFTVYGQNADFTQSPSNLGQTVANMWIVINDLHNRIASIETTCCKTDCSSVAIGFGVSLNDNRDTATLRFTYGNGTNIPDGFVDCGSVLSVTDTFGNVTSYRITIANDEEIDVDLSALNTSSDYLFTIETCMSNPETGVRCQKCITKNIKYQNTCAYCKFTNTSTSGNIILIVEGDEALG
jgi:hypothetical protein